MKGNTDALIFSPECFMMTAAMITTTNKENLSVTLGMQYLI